MSDFRTDDICQFTGLGQILSVLSDLPTHFMKTASWNIAHLILNNNHSLAHHLHSVERYSQTCI